MFFNSVSEILKIARGNGTAIFVVPATIKVDIPSAIILKPDGKANITIEQVRNTIKILSVKQTKDMFILIRPADNLNSESANALLKILEEPGEKVHFILITDEISKLLETIRSRAAIYYYFDPNFDEMAQIDDKTKELAKRMITAKSRDYVALAEELTKHKDDTRKYVLNILSAAVIMLYKSYFITKKDVFLKKIPKFINAYESILANGHIKLHLVADLL